jgi:hypothetical protein
VALASTTSHAGGLDRHTISPRLPRRTIEAARSLGQRHDKEPVQMGLDTTAFEHASPVIPCDQDDEDHVYTGHVIAWVFEGFERSLRGLQMGVCYEVFGEMTEFRAGSYSGYFAWREGLAQRALGVSAMKVGEYPSLFVNQPFFELIYFSDCEGTIGPEAASDLAGDFGALRAKIAARPLADPEEEAWFMEVYDQFQCAFERAARGGGLVKFH